MISQCMVMMARQNWRQALARHLPSASVSTKVIQSRKISGGEDGVSHGKDEDHRQNIS